jgi:hypothetical protein
MPYAKYAAVIPVSYSNASFITEAFSIFGAIIGFSIFTVLLAFAGMVPTWRNRRYYLYAGILLIALSYLLDGSYNVYLNLMICILAAHGLKALFHRRWELKIVRDLTMFVLALGMLFVLVSFIQQAVKGPPSGELIEAMKWLNENTKPQEIVLSSYENGIWIEYYARRPVVIDSSSQLMPDAMMRYYDTKAIFSSRNLGDATALLRQYRVRYILIDNNMEELLVNDQKQQGLRFLLESSDRFKKAKEYSGMEIWEFFG